MSNKVWVSLVLTVVGLVGLFTLGDYWRLVSLIVLAVGLIWLIKFTIGSKWVAPPAGPPTAPEV